MKIAVVKPDYKIVGGFEIVLDRIIRGFKKYGHTVDYVKVDMTKPKFSLEGLDIPKEIYYQNQEFFRYALSIRTFEKLDLSDYDIVLSTQPPSFAVKHKKVAVLFYHHIKIYYDLFDVYIECGLEQKKIHEKATEIIREIDNGYITNDKYYIAGSRHVANRIKKFNKIQDDKIYTFAAGINEEFYNYKGKIDYNTPICVGRHEFPKRPELFLHAMKHVKDLKGKVIGQGGKTEDLKKIDKYLTYIHKNKFEDIEDEYIWKKLAFNLNSIDTKGIDFKNVESNVIFTGRVTQSQLINEYANALCVVCPSYEEDYGLTAIEAMAFHKPVIACKDSGGYLEFIQHGKNGFIVEPTGEAIAEAINYLRDHPDKLREMGKNAYEFSRAYSWENAIELLNKYICKVASI